MRPSSFTPEGTECFELSCKYSIKIELTQVLILSILRNKSVDLVVPFVLGPCAGQKLSNLSDGGRGTGTYLKT